MNLLLIDTGSNRCELNEPLGIEMLSGRLKRDLPNITVDLKWLLVDDLVWENLYRYDLIGISAKPGSYNILEKLIQYLTKNTQCWIIIGGPVSTFGYKSLLNEFRNIFCVRGEGESALLQLCKTIQSKKKFSEDFFLIPNLAFFFNEKMVETQRMVENLSIQAPPDRKYVDLIKQKQGIARLEASRGCSWSKCSFCSVFENYGSNSWRPFPVQFVIENLKILSEKKILSPYFTDEDFFGGDYNRVISLAEEIIIEKEKGNINLKMNFFFDAKISDIIKTKALKCLNLWKRAGLREVFLGLESGCKSQLKRYGKAATPDKNKKALEILKKLNIQIDLGYILFDPEMNFNELKENIAYINDIRLTDYDARSLKNMRAHPFSLLTEKYIMTSIIAEDLDLNTLSFPIIFKDEKVKSVAEHFENWEKKYSENIYRLQSLMRGEVKCERERLLYKYNLSKIRKIDFQMLKLFVSHHTGKITAKSLKKHEIFYEKEKLNIIAEVISHSQSLNTA